MIYKVDFEGQACKQIKEKAESYQYDLKSVLKGIGLLIADMWLPGDSKPQIIHGKDFLKRCRKIIPTKIQLLKTILYVAFQMMMEFQ